MQQIKGETAQRGLSERNSKRLGRTSEDAGHGVRLSQTVYAL